MLPKLKDGGSFTLVEVVVIVAIIGILISITIPMFSS